MHNELTKSLLESGAKCTGTTGVKSKVIAIKIGKCLVFVLNYSLNATFNSLHLRDVTKSWSMAFTCCFEGFLTYQAVCSF